MIHNRQRRRPRNQTSLINIDSIHQYLTAQNLIDPIQSFQQTCTKSSIASNKPYFDVTLQQLQASFSQLNIQTKSSTKQLQNDTTSTRYKDAKVPHYVTHFLYF